MMREVFSYAIFCAIAANIPQMKQLLWIAFDVVGGGILLAIIVPNVWIALLAVASVVEERREEHKNARNSQ